MGKHIYRPVRAVGKNVYRPVPPREKIFTVLSRRGKIITVPSRRMKKSLPSRRENMGRSILPSRPVEKLCTRCPVTSRPANVLYLHFTVPSRCHFPPRQTRKICPVSVSVIRLSLFVQIPFFSWYFNISYFLFSGRCTSGDSEYMIYQKHINLNIQPSKMNFFRCFN